MQLNQNKLRAPVFSSAFSILQLAPITSKRVRFSDRTATLRLVGDSVSSSRTLQQGGWWCCCVAVNSCQSPPSQCKPAVPSRQALLDGSLLLWSVSQWMEADLCWTFLQKIKTVRYLKRFHIASAFDLYDVELYHSCLHHPFSVWLHRWLTEFGDRGNVPWIADQPAFIQVDQRWTTRTDIRKVYINIWQPLEGAVLFCILGVVLGCCWDQGSTENNSMGKWTACLHF